MDEDIRRLAAFSTDPAGGNPAGVVIGTRMPPPGRMRQIAAKLGYSETAFLMPVNPRRNDAWQVRYFAPDTEVDFCGHATIASAVELARRHGAQTFVLHSNVGPIRVTTSTDGEVPIATLESVQPQVLTLPEGDTRWTAALLAELLATFRWTSEDLDAMHPPGLAFAGVWHPIIALTDRDLLAGMAYDFEGLRALMGRQGWTTVQVVHATGPDTYAARDPFPVGGVVEDPATGAAAAAFGAYLRAVGLITPPARVTVVQGEDMGRRSELTVDIPIEGGILVSGHAVAIKA